MKFRKTIKIPAESRLQKGIPTWPTESLVNGERHKVLETCSLEKERRTWLQRPVQVPQERTGQIKDGKKKALNCDVLRTDGKGKIYLWAEADQ